MAQSTDNPRINCTENTGLTGRQALWTHEKLEENLGQVNSCSFSRQDIFLYHSHSHRENDWRAIISD